ncbi:hypothetical protein OGAPHI_004167 [Ogataea philodendri]|uniref:Uncharacterized protein n=1 Tax=Ogataea philodendri TaxID=1378263 RepID=A0A9P8P531_9ASCO|nr:uncharacterized protein OGAPHI_004167 [Ogataea philodendri]KAH3665978.1 hypothetical protein OGAPHI_004167 [Ogataea philodendri]
MLVRRISSLNKRGYCLDKEQRLGRIHQIRVVRGDDRSEVFLELVEESEERNESLGFGDVSSGVFTVKCPSDDGSKQWSECLVVEFQNVLNSTFVNRCLYSIDGVGVQLLLGSEFQSKKQELDKTTGIRDSGLFVNFLNDQLHERQIKTNGHGIKPRNKLPQGRPGRIDMSSVTLEQVGQSIKSGLGKLDILLRNNNIQEWWHKTCNSLVCVQVFNMFGIELVGSKRCNVNSCSQGRVWRLKDSQNRLNKVLDWKQA